MLLKFIRFFLKSVGANLHVYKKSGCHGTQANKDPEMYNLLIISKNYEGIRFEKGSEYAEQILNKLAIAIKKNHYYRMKETVSGFPNMFCMKF